MNCLDRLVTSGLLNEKKPGLIYFDKASALSDPHKNLSFKDFGQKVAIAQKNLLKLNLGPDDSAVLFELPGPHLFVVITALLGLGVKIVLVEPWLPLFEIQMIIDNLRPKLFVRKMAGRFFSLRVSSLRKILHHCSSDDLVRGTTLDPVLSFAIPGDHIGILTFTTGTTGKSKGVVRTHDYLSKQRDVIEKYIDYRNLDRLDLTVFMNLTLLNIILGKGSLVLPKWDQKILKEIFKLAPHLRPDTMASGPFFLKELTRAWKDVRPKYSAPYFFDTVKVGGALSDCGVLLDFEKEFNPDRFYHVYGSSEVEPVAYAKMNVAIKKSQEKNYFQCLFLGDPIEEISYRNEETLWVSGEHVSGLYLNDDKSNEKNKKIIDQKLYHNMGDRIHLDEFGQAWYGGRDFQSREEFEQEQMLYQFLQSSEGFISKERFITSLKFIDKNRLKSHFSFIKDVILVKEIKRDRRHRARIDREATLKTI